MYYLTKHTRSNADGTNRVVSYCIWYSEHFRKNPHRTIIKKIGQVGGDISVYDVYFLGQIVHTVVAMGGRKEIDAQLLLAELGQELDYDYERDGFEI
jgi:hypothetical protein